MIDLKSEITAIKPGKNLKIQRSNIYLNGKFTFSLDNEVIAKAKLKIGALLTTEEVKKLAVIDHLQLCLQSAFQFLSYRPRSEKETRDRLEQKGFDNQEIDKAIVQLKSLKLLNDISFAEFWKENRNSFKPRSQRLVSLELRRKGVETEIIQQVIGDIDDTENAHRVAAAKARTIRTADFQVFRQKLGGYLQRRGFNYGVINNTVKQVWKERTLSAVPESDLVQEVEIPD